MGLPEVDEDEDTDESVIREKLNIDIDGSEIIRSHRVGPKKTRVNTRSSKSYKSIKFKFLRSFNKRQEVFRAKRKLNGFLYPKISLNFDTNITKRQKQIFMLNSRGKIITVNSMDDLN